MGTGMAEMAGRPDWQLVQALNQAKAMLDRESRSEEDWDRLHTELDGALSHITGATDDISYVKSGLGDRFVRPTGPPADVMERAQAALIALNDRPDEERVRHALEAVTTLNRHLSG